uniref:ATP synthase F0 subunit 6 n=1 Tax=Ixodes myrmecobii TaxID=262305 RepID=UPI001FF1EB7C|nr:ATP synthase F0 subunit 6 [Ixodes myrmecobii]UOK09882.1 ATP synthase subunit 6 [Ixodes myrmecobii]
MMTNLFSIFDPSTSSLLSMNWITMMSIIIIPSPLWITPSRIQKTWKNLFVFISIEMKANMSHKTQKFLFFLISLFTVIVLSNLLGLVPYVFTPSSHIMFSMAFAFPIWISLMLYGWINHFNKMMIHLVPMGSPGMLTIFMVLIETISNVIRPITLSVRLSANMISGHLLIHLLMTIPYNFNQMFIMILPIIVALMFLESAVALIQSYVFVTLVSLYTNEI